MNGRCPVLVAVAYRGGPAHPESAHTATLYCPLPAGHAGEHTLPTWMPHDAFSVLPVAPEKETRA